MQNLPGRVPHAECCRRAPDRAVRVGSCERGEARLLAQPGNGACNCEQCSRAHKKRSCHSGMRTDLSSLLLGGKLARVSW